MKIQSTLVFDIGQAITPLDGRNRHKLTKLHNNFSDFILNKYRIKVEIEYLLKLSEYKIIYLPLSIKSKFKKIINNFSFKDYNQVRDIERFKQKVNHDLKAIEEFIKSKINDRNIKEMIHFGLTSDDTNNLAYGMMIKNTLNEVIFELLDKILILLKNKANEYKNISMLSRTHGQSASPTTLGKELLVYHSRLKTEILNLKKIQIKGKLTGNTGNLNAHKFIFPKTDWLKFSHDFVSYLGLKPDLVTTQIEPYDSLIKVFQTLLNINNILIGLSIDCWLYASFGYLRQKLVKNEVGSTALPHKINPIYFEGAEGGFGIANSLLEFYCRKLSYSRLQRDLSDSTVRRSFGIPLGYSILSYQSIIEAINRIEPSLEKINKDLDSHYEVLSEAIQNFLRTKGYNNAYDKTKEFFRGKLIDKVKIRNFIEELDISKDDKNILINLTPSTYTGFAEEIVNKFS